MTFRLFLILFGVLSCRLAPGTEPASPTLERVHDEIEVQAGDWPWWRGPDRNGVADAQQSVPVGFSEKENVVWKTRVPGRGHGSPAIWGDHIYLATSDEAAGSQSILCYSRGSGDLLWQTAVHDSGAMKRNKKATAASSTPACDGEHVFIAFPNSDALVLSALDTHGKVLWQKELSKYVVHQGYGASPALYQNLVIATADNKSGGAIAAYDRNSGDLVWRRERPEKPNYCSPMLLRIAGRDQLILVGCDQVVSYDPLTGETIWSVEGATTECVTSTVTDGKHIFTSGGYPKNHMSAIKADGSGETSWENDSRLYVPSLVHQNGYLYGVLDAGVATCWKADTGEEMWKKRIEGNYSSSPVLVGDKIFVASETGELYVFRAQPEGYEQIAKNQVGDFVYATPTIVGGRIYHRVVNRNQAGDLEEWLYCFGE